MESAENKSERLLQLEQILLAEPLGLTRAEIARRLNVHRATAGRYIDELSRRIPIWEEGNLLGINRDDYLTNIRLTIHESMAIHVATRLMATRMDKHNPHAAAALRKLGQALHKFAPQISRHLLASASVMDDAAQRHDPAYLGILETLTRAWSDGRLVHLWHKHESSGVVSEYDFAPYFIEPYAVGQTTHVIGLRRPPGKVRTLKVERIQRAELLAEAYTIPADFNPQAILADAWGIWYTEAEPVEVVLRFHPRVAGRVKESRWHRSETIAEQADGYLLWRARIAEPQEMLPWIRGWGADVEVVEPMGLRKAILTEVNRLNRVYKIETTPQDALLSRLLRCWGKTGKEDWDFHPALFHMFDVGHVAQQLLTSPASPRWRRILGNALNTEPETLAGWLPWFIAMHDIGKISVPFQAQNQTQKLRLETEGFTFGRWKPKDELYHTIIGQVFLKDLLKKDYIGLQLPRFLDDAWREMIGGHHGVFASGLAETARTLSYIQEPEEWSQLRLKTTQILQEYLLRQVPSPWPEPGNVSAAIMALTGFTILCDWLGSDSRYFSTHPYADLADYILISRKSADKAVTEAGFLQPSRSDAPTSFEQLFPQCIPLRPFQQAIDDIPTELLSQPCLTIIEAPTGEGKTEAALALAHRLAQSSGDDEFYCALPTTATSNQMFLRIQSHLRDRLGLSAGANLVHGQAFLIKDDLQIELLDNGDNQPQAALEWFSPKKKALLAPFGVGTIDQAELAALNVRHNALRLIGLAGKVVILDEVHAYDTYMTTIIEQMLRWLAALGSSVILLSATLPLSRRAALAQAYGVEIKTAEVSETSAVSAAYPSLWLGSRAGSYHVTPPAYQPERTFYLNFLHIPHDDALTKAQWLLEAVAGGGCACWITNTVGRAQKLAQVISDLDPTIDLLILHARFPLADRQHLEELIRQEYGPGGNRPSRSIVVGTQVLEQSLDLDFDLMVSDLAPVDLLLQRMGRVHRHPNTRPQAHRFPHLWVNCELDPEQPDLVKMGSDRFYSEYILQKTWQTIAHRTAIALPGDYRPLVEAVYSGNNPTPGDSLFSAWQKLDKQEKNALGEAQLRLLPDPNPKRPFCYHNRITFAEDEDSAAWIVAQTRLGPETITLIPLERDGDQARLIPTADTVDLNAAPSRETELKLLRRGLRLSQWHVVQYFKRTEKPKEILFKKSTLLKSVVPLWLTNGQTTLVVDNVTVTLALHPRLGLLIERSKTN
ncbi:MAG: CRISPR-associated helicase Cas3' [Anaerolineae bacterium]|nr:CRISPR-associated helicase Cas3' [Anaerolineae bacterium]